jgi:DNA polymerase I-like protein with 3'-5' exonuclease and polymerase domains
MNKIYDKVVFDLEANGFLETVDMIHIIAFIVEQNGTWVGPTTTIDVDWFLNYVLAESNMIIGHNITGYDIPVLRKMHPDAQVLKQRLNIFDTMLASNLIVPDIKGGHSIEAWAERLRLPFQKTHIEDFSKLTPEMKQRCISDVKINLEVFKQFEDSWLMKEPQVMQLECLVADIHSRQVQHGVLYDRDKATDFLAEMAEISNAIRNSITEGIPPTIKPGTVVTNPFKLDGELSVRVINHFGEGSSVLETIRGPFCKLDYVPFNLDSAPQVKDFLLSHGWKPTEYNFRKNPVTGRSEITSPKLTEDSYSSLPPGLGRSIADYRTIMHRMRMVEGQLTLVRDNGRVPSEALTCGTPTSRYRHSGAVCNIPRPKTLYGEEVRELFRVPDDHCMIGVDLSGIEARMMCHYVMGYPGGPELAEIVLNGDYHQYNADAWGVSRDLAKNGLYALIYGCGEAKLASTLGQPKGSGKELFELFWEGNPALKLLINDLETAVDSGRNIHGIDRRILMIRQKRKALNTLLQGGAAIVFKHWMRLIDEWLAVNWHDGTGSYVYQLIAYHDELQFEMTSQIKDTAEYLGEKFVALAGEAGRLLKINVPITAEAKIGKNWRQTH